MALTVGVGVQSWAGFEGLEVVPKNQDELEPKILGLEHRAALVAWQTWQTSSTGNTLSSPGPIDLFDFYRKTADTPSPIASLAFWPFHALSG